MPASPSICVTCPRPATTSRQRPRNRSSSRPRPTNGVSSLSGPRSSRWRLPPADTTRVSVTGSAMPLSVCGPRSSSANTFAHQRARGPADHHGVGGRGGLDPRGDVHRVAEREPLAMGLAAHLAHHDESGVDADACTQGIALERRHTRGETRMEQREARRGSRAPHPRRGSDRPRAPAGSRSRRARRRRAAGRSRRRRCRSRSSRRPGTRQPAPGTPPDRGGGRAGSIRPGRRTSPSGGAARVRRRPRMSPRRDRGARRRRTAAGRNLRSRRGEPRWPVRSRRTPAARARRRRRRTRPSPRRPAGSRDSAWHKTYRFTPGRESGYDGPTSCGGYRS